MNNNDNNHTGCAITIVIGAIFLAILAFVFCTQHYGLFAGIGIVVLILLLLSKCVDF